MCVMERGVHQQGRLLLRGGAPGGRGTDRSGEMSEGTDSGTQQLSSKALAPPLPGSTARRSGSTSGPVLSPASGVNNGNCPVG